MKRISAWLAAALTTAALALIPTGTANAATCWDTFHARPTGTGWVSDPCASRDYNDGIVTASVRVQHFWSQTGGPHITDIRGTYTICNYQAVRVSADAVALHRRSDGAEYASSIQGQQVSTGCATMVTVSKSARGCGATDAPAGPNAYQSYTEARGAALVGQTLYREPPSGYHSTASSYYLTVTAGAAC